jgi:hypothetical protein
MATAVYPSMQPYSQDSLEVLLCKAAYFLQAAAESASVTAATAMYPSMTPNAQDDIQVLAAKLAYWASQVSGGGGGGGGNPVDEQALGGIAPVTSTKNLVLDTDTEFLWYSGTKAAPWINI